MLKPDFDVPAPVPASATHTAPFFATATWRGLSRPPAIVFTSMPWWCALAGAAARSARPAASAPSLVPRLTLPLPPVGELDGPVDSKPVRVAKCNGSSRRLFPTVARSPSSPLQPAAAPLGARAGHRLLRTPRLHRRLRPAPPRGARLSRRCRRAPRRRPAVGALGARHRHGPHARRRL